MTRNEFLRLMGGSVLAAGIGGRASAQEGRTRMPRLKLSENRRFLVTERGAPFFYLGDTAWELLHRLNREEADLYLRDRAAKGFTVIQAVALAELDGLHVPNPYGETPLQNGDPTRPNEAYFRHVDWIIDRANRLGMYMGLLPTWGDKVVKKWGVGPEIFTPENARAYGEFLGRRYRDRGIIWILGGDRNPEKPEHLAIWRAMAEGVKAGDGGRNLRTYHPQGGSSAANFFHDDAWLDFNMLQSGHGEKDKANYAMIARDYAREPIKPCLDGEPAYEDHPINWKPENGWFDEYDVRKGAYWAVFAGACGHTYGCHDIWQMWQPGRAPISSARTPWQEAIKLPGSGQMRHLRALVESRPYLTRIPDQELLASDPGKGTEHVQATRGSDGSYAFIYSAAGKPVMVRMERLSGPVTAYWFDPRNGASTRIGEHPASGEREFRPPSSGRGQDWVLVLDQSARRFPAPGTKQ